MNTLSRVTAVAGTAFALLLAAPALAQAEDTTSGLTCEVNGHEYGSVAYHETVTFGKYCHGADGATVTAVAVRSVTDGVKVELTGDKTAAAVDVEWMDFGVEYVAEFTVTDGVSEQTFITAVAVTMRGTPDVSFKADENGKATGDLSRDDYRDDFTYTVWTAPKHGDLKLNADGTFVYTGDKGFEGDQFYFKVEWKTKYTGVQYEVRSAHLSPTPKPEPKPSKTTTKPAANGKDKLADTGVPAPMLAGTGAGALALGGGALWLARRRRQA